MTSQLRIPSLTPSQLIRNPSSRLARSERRDAVGCPSNNASELGAAAQRREKRAVQRDVVVRAEPALDRLLEQTKRGWRVAGNGEALAQMEGDVPIERRVPNADSTASASAGRPVMPSINDTS